MAHPRHSSSSSARREVLGYHIPFKARTPSWPALALAFRHYGRYRLERFGVQAVRH